MTEPRSVPLSGRGVRPVLRAHSASFDGMTLQIPLGQSRRVQGFLRPRQGDGDRAPAPKLTEPFPLRRTGAAQLGPAHAGTMPDSSSRMLITSLISTGDCVGAVAHSMKRSEWTQDQLIGPPA